MATERAGEVVSITSLDRISPELELAPTVSRLLTTRDPSVAMAQRTRLGDLLRPLNSDFVYEMLLLDEERHASLAEGFLERIASPKRKKWLRLRYKLGNKLRHFWGSQRGIRAFVDKTICIIVVCLILPFRRVLWLPAARERNLICHQSGKFLL